MKLTPIRAIRAKCLECCCHQAKEVRLCPIESCPLHAYRMGHRPRDDNPIDLNPDDENNEDSP